MHFPAREEIKYRYYNRVASLAQKKDKLPGFINPVVTLRVGQELKDEIENAKIADKILHPEKLTYDEDSLVMKGACFAFVGSPTWLWISLGPSKKEGIFEFLVIGGFVGNQISTITIEKRENNLYNFGSGYLNIYPLDEVLDYWEKHDYETSE